MATKRIEYIDWLKGLSIICVVWFHAPHPDFIDFSFRMPLFFLLSGIFFKIVPIGEHVARKTNQLLIPFIFFYLIYYVYILAEYAWSPTHAGHELSPSCWLDLFRKHTGTTCFFVNPPLWFIAALLQLQLILYVMVKALRRRWLIMTVAVVISATGIFWTEHTPTYFMFGRCLRYLGYYTFGHLWGKDLLRLIEHSTRSLLCVLGIALAMMALCVWPCFFMPAQTPASEAGRYLFNIALVISLIVLFKYVSRVRMLRFFHFYGRNSYIVLGMHYMLLQLMVIFAITVLGNMSPKVGFCMMVAILVALVPIIKLMNRYIPALVGKREMLRLAPLRVKI